MPRFLMRAVFRTLPQLSVRLITAPSSHKATNLVLDVTRLSYEVNYDVSKRWGPSIRALCAFAQGVYFIVKCYKIYNKVNTPAARLELATPGLGNRCSIHLSYAGIGKGRFKLT